LLIVNSAKKFNLVNVYEVDMRILYLLIGLLIISIASNVYLGVRVSHHAQMDFQRKYSDLKSRYISLAGSQKNLLEVMINKLDLKNETDKVFPGAYADLSDEKYKELIRRKIIRLDMEVKDLKNE
jgi:hypothetical protein